MPKMTGEEYQEIIRNNLLQSAQEIIDSYNNVYKNCKTVYESIAYTDDFEKQIDEKDFLFLTGIASEFDDCLDDEEKFKKCSSFYKKDLQDICKKILTSNIPKMAPPPEDPYSWPFPDDN